MSKKPIKKISHTLEDPEQIAAIAKRMKRANGQMTAVVRMLEEGRSCEDIVTQMAAVGKAINTAAFTLISASLKECLEEAYFNASSTIEANDKKIIPGDPDIPKILDRIYACHEVVKIDHSLPGCPPRADLLWDFLYAVVKGKPFEFKYQTFKFD